MLKGNAIIGQSGGPTAVINQSLVGAALALRGVSVVGKVLGAQNGVRGILEERFIDLGEVAADKLERIAASPSSALGSSRDKPDEEYCKKIVKVFAKNDVRYFFYIGGNDSSDTCRLVNEVAQKEGYELRAFHIPKTVDNDLAENDHTPGYASAARFVATAIMGDNLDNKALAGIKIDTLMGRHAGFLTAASLLARQRDDDGPHLIYVPEVAFSPEDFVRDVDRVFTKYGRCVVALSEGIHDAEGTPIISKLAKDIERDAHGNVQLSGTGALGDHLAAFLKEKMGSKLRVRADTFGYLQRSFPAGISPVDQKEAREVAEFAVKMALSGEHESGSVAIKRLNNDPYEAGYELIELSAVAAKTRVLPAEYIVDGNNIAESFRDYLLPLVGEMPRVEGF
ncbi:6-phosphofructokinase [Myxococcota bacterium]|nr:6-phosphofructokinase [Myxococcota bacterium]